MQTDITEERTVPMTEADIALSEEAIEAAYEKIGEIAVKKAKANAIAGAETKHETKIVDRETLKIETKEHRVRCYVEKDLHDGKARYYRTDTLEWVYSRDLEDWERQQPLTFETGQATNTASETAKKKSPGLNTAIDDILAAVSPSAVPDDVRAAVLAADVPADLVENAITAIRDGADPATVIHNAKRAGKPEKPAKEKKPKGKSKTTQTKPLGMDEFDPQTDDTKKWEADLAAAPLSEEDRAALAASPLSKRGFQRVLKRMQAGATLTHAIEAEVEVLVEHAASLVGEDNWRLIDDEFERADAFHLASLVEKGLPFDGALTSVRMRVKGRTLEAKAEAEASA